MIAARARHVVTLVAVTGITLGGCGLTAGSRASPPTTGKIIGPPTAPARTVVRNFRTYAAGQTGVLTSASQHASLRIAVGVPTGSTTRLDPTYGDAPRYGHYVTFALSISNTGQVPVEIRRLDFWVRTPGAHKTTTNDGNAPFSGAGSQLDTTELSPGQGVTNDLTFDVATATGTLFYAPGGHPAMAWTF